MAEEKNVESQDVQFESMPGADPIPQEDQEGFELDLSLRRKMKTQKRLMQLKKQQKRIQRQRKKLLQKRRESLLQRKQERALQKKFLQEMMDSLKNRRQSK